MTLERKSKLNIFLKSSACVIGLSSAVYLTFKYAKNKLNSFLLDRQFQAQKETQLQEALTALQKEVIISIIALFESSIFQKKINLKFNIETYQEKLKLCYSNEALMEDLKEMKIKHWESLKLNGTSFCNCRISTHLLFYLCIAYLVAILPSKK